MRRSQRSGYGRTPVSPEMKSDAVRLKEAINRSIAEPGRAAYTSDWTEFVGLAVPETGRRPGTLRRTLDRKARRAFLRQLQVDRGIGDRNVAQGTLISRERGLPLLHAMLDNPAYATSSRCQMHNYRIGRSRPESESL